MWLVLVGLMITMSTNLAQGFENLEQSKAVGSLWALTLPIIESAKLFTFALYVFLILYLIGWHMQNRLEYIGRKH